MNDSTFPHQSIPDPNSSDNSSLGPAANSGDDAPQFGALDIVEAFTAMRHEWRSQAKDSRALVEHVQAAVAKLQSLEAMLADRGTDDRPADSSSARQLVLHLVETDHQLSRAIAAIARWESSRTQRAEADDEAVERYFAGMNALARWFARPLLTFITAQRSVGTVTENPAVEGLNMVLARLRRSLADHGIERIDTEGQPFDASVMRAIGTVDAENCPSGYVAEQLSPAYRWQEQILRFADVRVAK